MNPQPHPIVGQFGVLIFSLLVAYFCFTRKRKEFTISDKFTIGYIDDNIQVVSYEQEQPVRKIKTHKIPHNLTTPVSKEQKKHTPIVKEQKTVIDNQLFEDCVLALVSLGTKKNQAKQIAKDIFIKHNPTTIEEFIKFVYIK